MVEKTREFRGTYHVLMGALSPLSGVGPDDLKIKGLLARVAEGQVQEVTWRATKLRTKDGEFLIVPRGVEHRPSMADRPPAGALVAQPQEDRLSWDA